MIERIADLMLSCDESRTIMPPTELFNEGWMLRVALDWLVTSGAPGHPLSLQRGSRWYSEALLPSQFLPTFRGDPLAESWTHADGVIGHFRIGEDVGGAAIVERDAKQLVVVEAKLMSPLSSGTKYAPDYDQAARNVACIAEVLARSTRRPEAMTTIGFYLVAPQTQRDSGTFGDLLTKPSIRSKVERRIASYRDRPDAESKRTWFVEWLLPTLERAEIEFLSWESLSSFISAADSGAGKAYQQFYERCLHFNRRRSLLPDRE